jgi:hypothetical protein
MDIKTLVLRVLGARDGLARTGAALRHERPCSRGLET